MQMTKTLIRCSCVIFAIAGCAVLSGCGASSEPCSITITINPAAATADHTLLIPGNQAQFTMTSKSTGNCFTTAKIPAVSPQFTTSDPVNTSIDANTGLAMCLNATSSPATISVAPFPSLATVKTAALTCK